MIERRWKRADIENEKLGSSLLLDTYSQHTHVPCEQIYTHIQESGILNRIEKTHQKQERLTIKCPVLLQCCTHVHARLDVRKAGRAEDDL